VVGAGFVGTEVASTAVALGTTVSLVEAAPVPFARTLGPEVGRLLAERYRAHGVDLHLGTGSRATDSTRREHRGRSYSRVA
jgi:NADPH-dependent 2,4-dienoyl-CoA reductase/sulfur reductase-like enzyme